MITGFLVLAAEMARTFLSAPAERRNLFVKISLARQAPLLCSVRSARLCAAEAHWRGCRMRGVKIKEKNRPARDDLPGHRCKKILHFSHRTEASKQERRLPAATKYGIILQGDETEE